MLTIDTTLKSLELKLAGAVATTELPFVCAYVDINQTSFAQTASSATDGTSTGGTAVTLAAAPGATTTRKLNYLSVVNVDTAAVVLTIQVNNNGTKRISQTFTLAVGDQVSFTDAGGWAVHDLNGNRKTMIGGILPAANFPALTGDVHTASGSLTTVIQPAVVTNAMLAGSIAASKFIGTDIATVGTITSGVWNAGAVTSSGKVVVSQSVAGFSVSITNTNGVTDSNGLLIQAGTTVNEYSLKVAQQSGTPLLFDVRGNGNTSIAGLLTVSGSAGPIILPNITATTGTALILDGGNAIRTLTSSRRFKTNIRPWRGNPRGLLALVPVMSDYKGGAKGVLSVLAEDVVRKAKLKELINFDQKHRPFSLRDQSFTAAIIALLKLQDIRIRSLERKAA